MPKQKLNVGDIFLISDVILNNEPLKLETLKIGKIIYISESFKKIIGFLVSQDNFEQVPNDVIDIEFSDTVLYTSNQLLLDGQWKVIGKQNVSPREEDLTLRLVSNRLYRLDDELEIVPTKNLKKYRKQLIDGFVLIYQKLNEN